MHAYYFLMFERRQNRKKWPVYVLCWFDFGPVNVMLEMGSLFKQYSCKFVCVLKTWFKQTQKHSACFQFPLGRCVLPYIFVSCSKFRQEWKAQSKKWNRGDHMQQAILNYRRSTGWICTNEIVVYSYSLGSVYATHFMFVARLKYVEKIRRCFLISSTVDFGTKMYNSLSISKFRTYEFRKNTHFKVQRRRKNTKRFMSF